MSDVGRCDPHRRSAELRYGHPLIGLVVEHAHCADNMAVLNVDRRVPPLSLFQPGVRAGQSVGVSCDGGARTALRPAADGVRQGNRATSGPVLGGRASQVEKGSLPHRLTGCVRVVDAHSHASRPLQGRRHRRGGRSQHGRHGRRNYERYGGKQGASTDHGPTVGGDGRPVTSSRSVGRFRTPGSSS